MKRKLSFFSLIFIALIMINLKTKAVTDEEVLYKYNTNIMVTLRENGKPVYLPKEMNYRKQEFRAAWVTTIWNLDIPQHTSEEQYKQEINNILGLLESYNMNALIFQVRPKNDAFYPSELNPWSRFLTGSEGTDPGWDPLAYIVEESHKRGMEFHAWFNPYRVFLSDLDDNNFVKKHPDYVLGLGEPDEILNPGIPEVQQFIIDTVKEVAENYDIDGVHFDDYFYPYTPVSQWGNKDKDEYQKYNPNGLSLDNWRRENVNKVIKGVKDALTEINARKERIIQFGISPFPVWLNKSSHPEGSYTSNMQSYTDLYADSKKWVEENWIDYVVPQTYNDFENTGSPYADTLNWWVNLVKGTNVNLYTGNAIYRYVEKGYNSPPWVNPKEIGNQILYNSKFPEVQGEVYFRLGFLKTHVDANLTYAQNALKNNFYKYQLLPPAVKNISVELVEAPENLSISPGDAGYQLTWDKVDKAKAYYVYRFESSELPEFTDIKNVVGIVYQQDSATQTFTDNTANPGVIYNYYVSAFNHANVETDPVGVEGYETLTKVVEASSALYNFNNGYDNLIAKINLINDLMPDAESAMTELNNFKKTINDYNNELNGLMTSINEKITALENKISNFNGKNLSELESDLQEISDLKLAIEEKANTVTASDSNIKIQLSQTTKLARNISKEFESLPLSTELTTTDLQAYLNTLQNILAEVENETIPDNQAIIDKINELKHSLTSSIDKLNNITPTVEEAGLSLTELMTLKDSINNTNKANNNSYDTLILLIDDITAEGETLEAKINELANNIDELESITDEPKGDIIDNPIFYISIGTVAFVFIGGAYIVLKRKVSR